MKDEPILESRVCELERRLWDMAGEVDKLTKAVMGGYDATQKAMTGQGNFSSHLFRRMQGELADRQNRLKNQALQDRKRTRFDFSKGEVPH